MLNSRDFMSPVFSDHCEIENYLTPVSPGPVEVLPSKQNIPLYQKIVAASIGAATAEFITFPIDTTKVHLQLRINSHRKFELFNGNNSHLGIKELRTLGRLDPTGYFYTMSEIYKKNGIRGFYRGWSVAISRAALNNGASATLYKPIRRSFGAESRNCSLLTKLLSGFCTGSVTQIVAAPSDMLKVRLQGDSIRDVPRYNGVIDAIKIIYNKHGIKSFWTGLLPSMGRAGCAVSATLGTYDHCKFFMLKYYNHKISDNWKLHVVSSSFSGLIASLVSCPFDVVKTRYQSQSITEPIYKSPMDCFQKLTKQEGFFALFKGFIPTYCRLGPWQLTFFLVYECLSKNIMGESF